MKKDETGGPIVSPACTGWEMQEERRESSRRVSDARLRRPERVKSSHRHVVEAQ